MKKLFILTALSLSLTGCAELQRNTENLPDNSILKKLVRFSTENFGSNSSAEVAATLSDAQFAEYFIKEAFPSAQYNKQEKRWFTSIDGDKQFIEYQMKDIKTSQAEKRFLLLDIHPFELHLFSFQKIANAWKLEAKEVIGRTETHRFFSDAAGLMFTNENIIHLGKNQLGFEFSTYTGGGTGGTTEEQFWVYVINNQMNIINGCISSSWRSAEMDEVCESKIRKDMPMVEGFYPIELNYQLAKYDVRTSVDDNPPKGWDNYGGGYFRKKLGSRKGKMIIEFNAAQKAYIIPKKFEKASNEGKLWEYFSK